MEGKEIPWNTNWHEGNLSFFLSFFHAKITDKINQNPFSKIVSSRGINCIQLKCETVKSPSEFSRVCPLGVS